MILQKQNLYSYKLISVNTLYYYKVSAKYCIPAHMTRWCTVSQYLADMIVHELWYNFCLWLKQDVHALSNWCPDVIIFFLRHLDAYNEMVVCVIISEWQMYWCADSLGAFDFKRQNDQCMTSKYRESDKRADGSYAFEWHWPFCAAPLKVERAYWWRANVRATGVWPSKKLKISKKKSLFLFKYS